MHNQLSNFLLIDRIRPSSISRTKKVDQFYSDRSRILYSSSFRRLQQKAQVFSLESNSSVRTRLTHSLEVSDLGRTLANKIATKLYNKQLLSIRAVPEVVAIVENACLIHDIGNPPFGHFGEAAIKDWANRYLKESLLPNLTTMDIIDMPLFQKLYKDFLEFDGNPQGFRIISKLHVEADKYSLNLTYATLLCSLKYSRSTDEEQGSGILKKAGYFQTEKTLVDELYRTANMQLNHRYPLTYIMEAADDIAYCLSDISDGIEKRIITPELFISEFKAMWDKNFPNQSCPVPIPDYIKNFSLDISVPWSKIVMEEAVSNYISNYKKFLDGSAQQLIPEDSTGKILDIIKKVSRKTLYASIEAESIELTGYAVITGILKHYQRLINLSYEDFQTISQDEICKNLDFEKRLFNRLGKRYVIAYKHSLNEYSTDINFKTYELWLRIHLIIDHVSGMTDDFALQTYQMLEGINMLK